MPSNQRRLIRHGLWLFLLGLLTGLIVSQFSNPRMGLAAHLEGVMNGTFLLALGAAWAHVHLTPGMERLAVWATLYGTYANWATTTLAAIFATGAMTPITAEGHSAAAWQETLVSLGFVSVAVAMISALALLLWGLRDGRKG